MYLAAPLLVQVRAPSVSFEGPWEWHSACFVNELSCFEPLDSHRLCSPRSLSKKLSFWEDFCSAFTTSKNFQMLDLDNCTFSEASLAILYKALAQPVCKLQKFT